MSATDRTLLLQLFNEAKKEDYPKLKDEEFFEIFVPFHFLKNFELDFGDIENGIVDGPTDGGIDSIFALCDGRPISEHDATQVRKGAEISLYIFSTKFIDSFKTNVLNNIRATLFDLCTLDDATFNLRKAHYKKDLVDTFEEFRTFYVSIASRFPVLRINVIYATASSKPAGAEVTSPLAIIANELSEQFSGATVNTIAADARTVLDRVREPADQVRPLEISGSSINNTRGPSYVALVRLHDYYQFVKKPDGPIESRLFDDNVRDFEGDVSVNKDIAHTLSNPNGPDFWWLNNGISIICDSATLSGGTLQIRNPKIVNGLQTSRKIYSHFASGGIDTNDRLLLVRIISATDDASRSEIIRATNRQTPILPAQLTATSSLHKDIELFLRGKGIYYERRKNYWKNQGKKRAEIVSITDIAQAMITAVGGRPNTARARPGTILKETNDKGTVFNSKYDPKIYEKAINLIRSVDNLIERLLPDIGRRDRNNIKFQVAAKIVMESTGNRFDPTIFMNAKLCDGEHREKIVEAVYELYISLGATDAVGKSEDFWAKVQKL